MLPEAQRDLMALPGVGASILEISHRSKAFEDIIAQAETNLRQLLAIPDDYAVLFLQGGARLQFSMIPMNLMGGGRRLCNYMITGSWSKYAAQEAAKFGEAKVIWDGKATNYDRLPATGDLNVDPQGGLFLLRVERNDPGRAVSRRSRKPATCRSCATRRAISLSRPRRRQESTDCSTRAPEERRPGGRDDRHHSQRPAGAEQRNAARLSELQACTPRSTRCGTRRRRSRSTS